MVDVDAVGPLRVTKALLPLLRKSGAALIVNISSEAGSIGRCYRTNMIDYGMAKAALNMATMVLRNTFRERRESECYQHPSRLDSYECGKCRRSADSL